MGGTSGRCGLGDHRGKNPPAGSTVNRRGLLVPVGTATAFLGEGITALAQTTAAVIPGKARMIVRSPRPLDLDARLDDPTSPITPQEAFLVRHNIAARCGICHGLELVDQQGQSQIGWEAIANSTETCGVPIPAEEKIVSLN